MHLGWGMRSLSTMVADNWYTYVCRINVSLDDVQDGYIASCLAGGRRYHTVLRLQEAAHDI